MMNRREKKTAALSKMHALRCFCIPRPAMSARKTCNSAPSAHLVLRLPAHSPHDDKRMKTERQRALPGAARLYPPHYHASRLSRGPSPFPTSLRLPRPSPVFPVPTQSGDAVENGLPARVALLFRLYRPSRLTSGFHFGPFSPTPPRLRARHPDGPAPFTRHSRRTGKCFLRSGPQRL